MTFKNEYIITGQEKKVAFDIDSFHRRRKEQCSYEMGKLISNLFNYKETEKPPHLHSEDTRYKLEFEAFPMDKWMKFKSGIIECIEQVKADNYPPIFAILSIGNLLKELESFGKPSGDTITNQQLNK